MAKKRTARKKASRTASRKKTTRSATRKKSSRAGAAKKSTAKAGAIKPASKQKPRTKAQVYRDIAEHTDLTRQQVVEVFDVLSEMIQKDLNKGPGVFNFAGLMKIQKQRKPATKARKGVNPFTGEEIMIKAKPARNVIKVRPLKTLKEMV